MTLKPFLLALALAASPFTIAAQQPDKVPLPAVPAPRTDPGIQAAPPGVVRPPQTDPAMTVPPPHNGTATVIPPPGTPGNNPALIPK